MAIPPSLIRKLSRIVGREYLDTGQAELLVYESDGLRLHAARPGCVVYPASTGECARVVKACCQAGVPFVPRGAGPAVACGDRFNVTYTEQSL